ncbi:hypothetical protein ACFZCL_35465 [Streptomyces sp. NPDC008159]|uniref:hypothetical protein n=1 Tax=Streptomyces sp. NPDC008159 TaxID=3364817 RepID=UPI0036EEF261
MTGDDSVAELACAVREAQMLLGFTLCDVAQILPKKREPTEPVQAGGVLVTDLQLVAEEGGRWLGSPTEVVFDLQRDDHLGREPHAVVA